MNPSESYLRKVITSSYDATLPSLFLMSCPRKGMNNFLRINCLSFQLNVTQPSPAGIQVGGTHHQRGCISLQRRGGGSGPPQTELTVAFPWVQEGRRVTPGCHQVWARMP